MASAVLFEEQLCIPFVANLEEFRCWLRSAEFPERGRIDYIAGQIEVDMSPEDLFMHGSLKTEIASVIYARVKQMRSGEVFTDRTRISCPEADLSVDPDVVYLSNRTFDSGRIKLVPKASEEPGRYIEIEGPPDLVVEIVSDSSEGKDTRRLPSAYFLAGVRELWIIDARGKSLKFEIYRRGSDSFTAITADKKGFKRSPVLRRQYRLKRRISRRGWPLYELIERD